MSTTITRLFDDGAQAQSAIARLRLLGFTEQAIHVVAPPAPPAPVDPEAEHAAPAPAADGIDAALRAAGVQSPAAGTVAARVRQGATAVIVRAPFGQATTAIDTLHAFGGVDLGLPDPYDRAFNEGTPLSAMFGIPVLTGAAAPLSSGFGVGTLSRSEPSTTLSPEPAPLSRLLSLPVLSGGGSVGETSMGLPLLSHNPAPLSSLLGLPLLSRSATPLSSALGLHVLHDGPEAGGTKR